MGRGILIYDDINKDVSTGGAGHYDYQYPVTHWTVFGNFINDDARSDFFSIDFDDWTAWTDKPWLTSSDPGVI